IDLRFDGRPLAVEADGRFQVPPHDPGGVHALEAELTFPDQDVVRVDLAFGGILGERVTSALTAVPVTSPPGESWTLEDVEGWLAPARRDRAVPKPFSTSAEAGVVFMVKEPGARVALQQVHNAIRRWDLGRARRPKLLTYSIHAAAPRPLAVGPPSRKGGTFELWDLGGVHPLKGLWADVYRFRMPRPKALPGSTDRPKRGALQIWDAVAVAGARAARTNRPRALVVILAGSPDGDRSQLTLGKAARYLERIRVPFYLWVPDRRAKGELEPPPSVRAFAGPRGMVEMQEDITLAVASQTMVWIEGEFLPQEVSLSKGVPAGVQLVR
ncbi:MAG: hypothetical protein AAGD06_25370, partial [Acidobacteriota bacterium]